MTDEVQLHAPPVLSTPETYIFEDLTPLSTANNEPRLTDDEIWSVYEVERTAREISKGGWRRIALQFPDHMLGDAVRVFEGIERELKRLGLQRADNVTGSKTRPNETTKTSFDCLSISVQDGTRHGLGRSEEKMERFRLHIMGDTSYGSCCVDEIAAEHVDAEVVVHYGRSCLSPTARLPVIYVFTSRTLDVNDIVAAFEGTYTLSPSNEKGGCEDEKVVLVADIIYHSHISAVKEELQRRGWRNVVAPEMMHDPLSLIPNRKIEMPEEELKEYSVFHISDPPPALLLTLASRVKSLYIYPTIPTSKSTSAPTRTLQSNTSIALRRRYALLTSLSTCGIFGILINTLSVRNYLATISSIKDQIKAAGKKSYTFVVGKVNAAKIANFSEIGGWVVVGCWESSLIESTEFYRPIITPFELALCLMSDRERVWSGEWRGDFEALDFVKHVGANATGDTALEESENVNAGGDIHGGDLDSEEESAPPEFDLRTGRYVSHSRPLRKATSALSPSLPSTSISREKASQSLARRAKLEVASVNGAVSPGAEYLRSQRTWTGLGSDFSEVEASENIEEGRSGIARGYTVGEGGDRR